MPAVTDFDITIPRLSRIPRIHRTTRRSTSDTAPAVNGRTNGLRAYAPPTSLAAMLAVALHPRPTPWMCSCMVPAPCDGRCLVCGGSL
jgi:hypothetical protein